MKITLNLVSGSKRGSLAESIERYVQRSKAFAPTSWETLASETALLVALSKKTVRAPAVLLADVDGRQMSSLEIAAFFERQRDAGVQHLIFAVGPADGWSAAARAVATERVSFGRITLPHELAALVAAEQMYRALTILARHPYHCGH